MWQRKLKRNAGCMIIVLLLDTIKYYLLSGLYGCKVNWVFFFSVGVNVRLFEIKIYTMTWFINIIYCISSKKKKRYTLWLHHMGERAIRNHMFMLGLCLIGTPSDSFTGRFDFYYSLLNILIKIIIFDIISFTL